MEPKYTKGQKVKIVSVKNQHLHTKYPQIEQHVSERGTIVESYWVGFGELSQQVEGYYIYTVRIDKDKSEVAIPEDALEPIT
jgi:hypothetical protein